MSAPEESSETMSDNTVVMENRKGSGSPQRHVQNDNMELKKMQGAEEDVGFQEDIMQLARLGDVGGIQKLFDQGKFSPSYKDEEGITPLHVSRTLSIIDHRIDVLITWLVSGQRSTTNMPSVNISSGRAQRSMPREGSPSRRLQCGRRRSVTTIL